MAGVMPLAGGADAALPEWRGLWVEATATGIHSPAEVAQLVRTARAAHVNCLLVESVQLGQAYYHSEVLPRAAVAAGVYDPLAEVLRQAHDPAAGARLEVHAWVRTLPVWNQRETPPVDGRHSLRQHPEWMTREVGGTNFGRAYVLDPGHPAVADQLVATAVELVSRYELDGVYLDDLWYPAGRTAGTPQLWGYNPVAVERFQRLFQRKQPPRPDDRDWEQFRRDQITFLVRRMALEVGAIRLSVRFSVACRAEASGVYPIVWERTDAFRGALQDWRTWLRDGYLDTAVPLMYFEARIHLADWQAWREFFSVNRHHRQIAVGLGSQFNPLSETLALARAVRESVERGGVVEGLVFSTYAGPAADQTPAEFFSSLVRTNQWETHPVALYTTAVSMPEMPWKKSTNRARLLGRAQAGALYLDGARVELRGRVSRRLTADANGWFGAVDLPPDDYLIRVFDAETNRVDLVGMITLIPGTTMHPKLLLAQEDSDHDGNSNEAELIAGTDPQDPESRLRVNATVLPDRLLLRAEPVLPNRRYVIEAAANSFGPWIPLTDSVSLDGSEATAAGSAADNYFRVRVSY